MIELRKRRIEDAMDQGGDTPALYTVLPEKKTTGGGGAQMMGSAHVYDMSGVSISNEVKIRSQYLWFPLWLEKLETNSRTEKVR